MVVAEKSYLSSFSAVGWDGADAPPVAVLPAELMLDFMLFLELDGVGCVGYESQDQQSGKRYAH